ncbi:MAG TPA: hypothetical protein VNS55_02400 [Nocardioides sp.]|nr:hypothetical protein [Nocardioides sp.]
MSTRAAGGPAVVVLLLLALLLGACGTVKEPDPEDWDETARVSLTDAASEVSAVKLTLVHARSDDLWRSYAVVVLADAEEAVGKAEDKVTVLQPPPARTKVADKVANLLATASDVVGKARQSYVASHRVEDQLLHRLDVLAGRLEHQAKAL